MASYAEHIAYFKPTTLQAVTNYTIKLTMLLALKLDCTSVKVKQFSLFTRHTSYLCYSILEVTQLYQVIINSPNLQHALYISFQGYLLTK